MQSLLSVRKSSLILLMTGVYPVQFAQMIFREKPVKQITTGCLQEVCFFLVFASMSLVVKVL